MGYFSSRIEVEELLPHSRSYRDINFYWFDLSSYQHDLRYANSFMLMKF
jgi:hypothetical protein